MKVSAFLLFGMLVAGALYAQESREPQPKSITNPAEYNTFVTAINGNEAPAIERFLQLFPESIVKEETLDRLMSVYQQTDDPKVTDAAQRLLQVSPNSVRALAVLAYRKNLEAKRSSDSRETLRLRNQSKQLAQTGLRALPLMHNLPSVWADGDYANVVSNATNIFKAIVVVRQDSKPPDLPPVYIPDLPKPRFAPSPHS